MRERLINKALDSVAVASKAQDSLHELQDDEQSRQFLEASVRSAIAYGYPVETVAEAASMSVADITAIATRSMAA